MQAAATTGPAARSDDPTPPPRPTGERGWIVSAAALGATAIVVLGFFLSVYVRHNIPVPLGWDTSRYLWQTSFVQAEGLDALREPLPPPYKPSLSRPAFPIIAATTSSATGVSIFRVAAVLPSVLALVIGVAAGAFVSSTLRRPLWQLVVVALAVATSAYVVRLAAPEAYQDNLSAAAILLAAAVPITLAVSGARGMTIPAIALLAAGAVTHWVFFLFFAAVLGLTGVVLLPGSWRAWRSGTPLFSTEAGRLGIILGGGGALGAATIFGVLGAAPERPKFSYPEFRKKLRVDVPKYRLPVALPLAAVGAASLVRGAGNDPDQDAPKAEARASRRFVAILLGAWVAVAAAGVAAFLAGKLLPAHRFLAFALAVPILGILGLLAIGRWIAGRPGAPRYGVRAVLGGAVVVVVLAVSAAASYKAWDNQPKWARMDREKVSQAAIAGAYLDRLGVPASEPFVFVVDDRGPNPDAYIGLITHVIRAALPANRLRSLHIFVGTPEDFLAGRVSDDGLPAHTEVADQFLNDVRPLLPGHPIAFVSAALNDHAWPGWIGAHPESRVGGDVAVVQGPLPTGPVAEPSLGIGPLSAYKWMLFGAALLLFFGLIGLGWTAALLGPRLRRFEVLALAPAVGLAALVMAGIAADRVGLRLAGASGAMVPAAAALAGWAVWLALRARRRSPATPAATPA